MTEEFTVEQRERAIKLLLAKEKNRPKLLEKRKANKEKKKTYMKKWNDDNREKVKVQRKKWRVSNKNHITEYARKYNEDNKEWRAVYDKARYESERPMRLNRMRLWYKNNTVKHSNYYKKWYGEHPLEVKVNHARRRALEQNAEGSHTVRELELRYAAFKNLCIYCGRENISHGELRKQTEEHMVSLFEGGSNWISNIYPACRSCNCAKKTKSFEEFMSTFAREEQDVIISRITVGELVYEELLKCNTPEEIDNTLMSLYVEDHLNNNSGLLPKE